MEHGEMFIGEISKQTGIPINTIRFYENQGVLEIPKRSESGYRLYKQDTVSKLQFIKKAQGFGLTLGEIRVIIKKSQKGIEPCCDHVKGLLDKKIREFDKTIKELQGMKKGLKALIKTWVPLKEAKARSYSVCPQFEKPPKKTNRMRKK